MSNLPASRGRSFCRSSNRLLDSVLVMFLRDRRWPVGACAFHIQPAKQTLRMSTKVAFPDFPPTHFYQLQKLPSPCATRWFGLLCLHSRAWTSPLSPTGVPSGSELVKKLSLNLAQQDLTSDCLTSD